MNKFATRPLYLQVRDALAGRIAAGEWKPETAVPNENDLAREFGVSPGTMRKALDLLEAEALVTRRQGRGTFVNDPASPKLATRYDNLRAPNGERVVGEITIVDATTGPADHVERMRLRLKDEQNVCRIKRIRTHSAQTYLNEQTLLPEAMFPGLAGTELCSRGIVTIANAYGVLLGGSVECISLGTASQSTAEVLSVDEGSPVFVLDRVIETRDGRPAEWRRAECKGDMHYLVKS